MLEDTTLTGVPCLGSVRPTLVLLLLVLVLVILALVLPLGTHRRSRKRRKEWGWSWRRTMGTREERALIGETDLAIPDICQTSIWMLVAFERNVSVEPRMESLPYVKCPSFAS